MYNTCTCMHVVNICTEHMQICNPYQLEHNWQESERERHYNSQRYKVAWC